MTWKYRRHVRYAYCRHPLITFIIGCIHLVALAILIMVLQEMLLIGVQTFLGISDQERMAIDGMTTRSPPSGFVLVFSGVLTAGYFILAFWSAPIWISRPRLDARFRSKALTAQLLKEGLMQQVLEQPDLHGQLKVMAELLEEYLQRFLGFVHLVPQDLERHMGSEFWWMVQVSTQELKNFRREEVREALPKPISAKIDAYVATFARWDSMRLYQLDFALLESEMLGAVRDLRGVFRDESANRESSGA